MSLKTKNKKYLQITRTQIARTLIVAIIGTLMSFVATAPSSASVMGSLVATAADDSAAFVNPSQGVYILENAREYETFTVVSSNSTLDSTTVSAYPRYFRYADLDLIRVDGEETVTVVVHFFNPAQETITVYASNTSSAQFTPITIGYYPDPSLPTPTAIPTSVDSVTVESLSNPGSVQTTDNEVFTILTTSNLEEFNLSNPLGKLDGMSFSVSYTTSSSSDPSGTVGDINWSDESVTVRAHLADFHPVVYTLAGFQKKAYGRGLYSTITVRVLKVHSLGLTETVTVITDNEMWESDAETEIPSLNTDSSTVITLSSTGGTVDIDAIDGALNTAPNIRSLNPETATARFLTGTNTVEITGVDAGTTTIEIGYAGMESATVAVNVNRLTQPPIILTVDSSTIGAGQTTATHISGGEGNGAVTYASGNSGICTVNSGTGVVTGVATGSCVVTVTKAAGSTGGIKFLAATATVNVTVDATAPTVSSKATNSGGTKVILTYSEILKNVTPLVGAYAVLLGGAVDTVTAVAIVGSNVELTLTNAVANGNSITVAYTPGSGTEVQDLYGNLAANFTAAAVTNNVPAPNSGGSSGGGLTFADEEKIRLANEKAAAEKAAAEKAAADAAAAQKLAEEKAAAERAAAAKADAEAKALLAAEEQKKADAEAAIRAKAEAKAAANTGKVQTFSKSTKITLDLADMYYGQIAFVELVTKVKGRTKITVLDYFVINKENGTATSIVKKLAKGQRIQVRVGTKIVFRATI